MKGIITVFILTVLLFGTTKLPAQDDPHLSVILHQMTLQDILNTPVTTATKKAQSASEAPATIYVITEEQIHAKGYSILEDVLENIPEFEIQRKTLADYGNVLTARGIQGNSKFIILIDGIRFNSPTGEWHAITYNYPIMFAERIEIILGPASALYGADAFSGIINIVTKQAKGKPFVSAKGSYGLFNTTDDSFVAGIGDSAASITVSASYYHSDEPFFPDIYPKEYAWYNEHYKNNGEMNLFGKTVIVPIQEYATPTDAYFFQAKARIQQFSVGYARNYISHTSTYGAFPNSTIYSKDAVLASSVDYFYATHEYAVPENRITLLSTISYIGYERLPKSLFINNFSSYQNAYKYAEDYSAKIEEQVTYSINTSSVVTAGLSYEQLSALPKTGDLPVMFDRSQPAALQDLYWPGTNVVDKNGNSLKLTQDFLYLHYYNIGMFGQYQGTLWKALHLTVGARYDDNSRYGATFNPRIGVVFLPDSQVSVKVLYGRSFLAPSSQSYQQYGSFYTVKDSTGGIIGLASDFLRLSNPNLRPEINNTYEGSVGVLLTRDMNISVNAFYNDIYGLIVEEGYSRQTYKGIPVAFVKRPVVKGKAESFGGTIKADGKFQIGRRDFLNASVIYTYIDGNIDGRPLIYSSKNTIKASVGWSGEKFDAEFRLLYRSESNAEISTPSQPAVCKPFTIVNAYASYNITTAFRVFVKINNLFDARYYNPAQNMAEVPQDPIRIVSGIAFSL